MPMYVESLEMAKRRDKKVYITDIAIDKVPFIQYKGFTDNQNRIMRELAQEVILPHRHFQYRIYGFLLSFLL